KKTSPVLLVFRMKSLIMYLGLPKKDRIITLYLREQKMENRQLLPLKKKIYYHKNQNQKKTSPVLLVLKMKSLIMYLELTKKDSIITLYLREQKMENRQLLPVKKQI